MNIKTIHTIVRALFVWIGNKLLESWTKYLSKIGKLFIWTELRASAQHDGDLDFYFNLSFTAIK